MFAQLVRRFGADDLVNGVFDDGGRETRGDVLHACPLFLRLLDRAVHEHGAAAAQFDGVFCKQAEFGKLVYFHAHRLGKSLDKGAAPRRARLVEHDVVDGAVFDFKALDVLPADVDDEIHFGVEMHGGFEVCHRLDDAEICLEGGLHHVLAVARDRRACNADAPLAERVDLAQALGDDVQRLAVVGLIMLVQKPAIGGDEHEFCRGGTAVHAEIGVPFVFLDVRKGEVARLVAGDKFFVLFPVGKQRFARDDVVTLLHGRNAGNDLFQRERLHVLRIQRRADGHEAGRVFGENRVLAVQMKGVAESLAQPLDKVQRPAQKEHFALDAPALRQAGDRLIDHRLENAGGDVLLFGALVQKRLNVRFGKHAAAGSDGIHLFRLQGELVHLVHGEVEQGGHLVDKGARAARAGTVHALFGAARDKDDLRVLAAQLHRRVRVGIVLADGGKRRLHFLHEGKLCAFGKSQPRGTRHADAEPLRAELLFHNGELVENALFDARKMALVTRI